MEVTDSPGCDQLEPAVECSYTTCTYADAAQKHPHEPDWLFIVCGLDTCEFLTEEDQTFVIIMMKKIVVRLVQRHLVGYATPETRKGLFTFTKEVEEVQLYIQATYQSAESGRQN